MQTRILVCLLVSLLLVGCSAEPEVVVPEVPDKRVAQEQYTFDSVSINSITMKTAYEEVDGTLYIYPYNNSDEYITIERIVISDRGFWDTAIKEYNQSANLVQRENYSFVTLVDGTTIGYVELPDNYAYIVKSVLPSAYVEAVLDKLCSSDI